jgi:hypothetical protein
MTPTRTTARETGAMDRVETNVELVGHGRSEEVIVDANRDGEHVPHCLLRSHEPSLERHIATHSPYEANTVSSPDRASSMRSRNFGSTQTFSGDDPVTPPAATSSDHQCETISELNTTSW